MRDDFQLTDLVGFARLLGVKENDNFEDFMVEILDSYNQQEKKQQRLLLSMARDVATANKELKQKDKLAELIEKGLELKGD
jgi:hypothetical protein